MDINTLTLSGVVKEDSTLTELKSTKLLKLILVVKDKKGDYEFEVESFNIDKNFAKGTRILIQGQIKQEKWKKDGKSYSKVKILANSILPL